MVPLVLGRVSSHGVESLQFLLPRLSHSNDMIVALCMQGLGLVYDVTACQRNVKGAVHPADQWSDLRPSEQCIQRTSGQTSVPPSSASSGPVVRPPSLRAVHPADQWSDLRPSEQCIQRTSRPTSIPPSSASSGPVVRPPSLRAVHPADQWSDLHPSEQCIQRTSGPTSIPPSSASSGPVVRPLSKRRAAIAKRAAVVTPPLVPPSRRRRPVKAAAGNPDEGTAPSSETIISVCTAEIVALSLWLSYE